MITLVLLAQILAAGPATTATPVVKTDSGTTRTLADVARERKLGKTGVKGGTLSVTGAERQTSLVDLANAQVSLSDQKAALEAQQRLLRALEHEAWVRENIHYNQQIIHGSKVEWDAAAESCRKTPGCTPIYRK